MIFNVIQEDIDKGYKGNSRLSPVALCLQRELGRADIDVNFYGIYLGGHEIFVFRKLNGEVSEIWYKIDSFDLGHGMRPFSFELNILFKD